MSSLRATMVRVLCLIACLLGCWAEKNPEMEALVNNISELASKVLDIFEPLASRAAKAANDSTVDDPENTYFVSFLLRDRKNKTATGKTANVKQRMVVNNNFSGDKLGTNQVYYENGPAPKQPPSHNIQMMNNKNAEGNPTQTYQQPYQPPFQPPQEPQADRGRR